MYSEDQKWFERFTHFGSPRFNCAVDDDICDFMINFGEKLNNLCSLELPWFLILLIN